MGVLGLASSGRVDEQILMAFIGLVDVGHYNTGRVV